MRLQTFSNAATAATEPSTAGLLLAALLALCCCLAAPLAAAGQNKVPIDAARDLRTAHPQIPAASQLSEAYKIGAGDVLQVSVWREETLSQRVVVRPDGKITLPLISEVTVGGKTPLEVRGMLERSFAAYIEHPSVTVSVVEPNSQVVYILGEVQRPGAYPILHTMDVLQLIASAGGLTPYAKKKNIVLMHDKTGQRSTLDYKKLLKGKSPDQNGSLTSGDLVVVP